jgi:protein-disulfide isomerase
MRSLLLGTLLLGAACSSTSAQPAKHAAPGDVVATVGPVSVTLAQVDDKALQQSTANFGAVKLSQALYEARRAAIDDIVAVTLMEQEAKARGTDRAALVEKEIGSQVPPVTDVDVATWYQANQARVQGAPLDQVRAPIRAYLIQERMEEARQRYIAMLKSKTPVRILLEPPRLAVAAANGPTRGNAKAPIEMIEFSDFQCPYCLRAYATVNQVLANYGDRIYFVYRHYPLPNHPQARPAAEASACAAEQGKFWQYHDRLFASPTKLAAADLKQHAADLGLDATKFNTCVDARTFKAQVDADVKDGDEAGVNGTPAFFINGRMLSGAMPYEAFKRIIDEELELKRTKN